MPRTEGHFRDRVRADLRRREAPPPQARPDGRSGAPRHDQSGRLRRLRRLLGAVELHLGRAAGDGDGAQAHHQPVVLQQGLFLPQGLLPVLRHHRRRQAAPPRAGRARRHRRFAGAGLTAAARQTLQHRGGRRRRHRRADHRRAARHGRAHRGQGQHDPRHVRPCAKGRGGAEPCPALRAHARRDLLAHRHRHRRSRDGRR